MVTPSTRPDKKTAWYASVRAYSALTELMERELDAATGMPVAWYDVLVQLYLAPAHSMRMSDLANAVLTSRSWLSRRVDQLVAAGLVERCSADADGRGVQARLTRDGKRAYLKLERAHAATLEQFFTPSVTASEAELIRRVMNDVAGRARTALGLPDSPDR